MRFDDFRYLTNRTSSSIHDDKEMWDDLVGAFTTLGFSQELVREIWSIVAATLLLGNLEFEPGIEDEPCEVKNA
jgi:myosin heavy subunit